MRLEVSRGRRYPVFTMVLDTPMAAQRRYAELLSAQAPVARLAQALSLSTAVRELALAGIRARHPHALDDEIRARLAVRLYGRDTALRIFARVPLDAI